MKNLLLKLIYRLFGETVNVVLSNKYFNKGEFITIDNFGKILIIKKILNPKENNCLYKGKYFHL